MIAPGQGTHDLQLESQRAGLQGGGGGGIKDRLRNPDSIFMFSEFLF